MGLHCSEAAEQDRVLGLAHSATEWSNVRTIILHEERKGLILG